MRFRLYNQEGTIAETDHDVLIARAIRGTTYADLCFLVEDRVQNISYQPSAWLLWYIRNHINPQLGCYGIYEIIKIIPRM